MCTSSTKANKAIAEFESRTKCGVRAQHLVELSLHTHLVDVGNTCVRVCVAFVVRPFVMLFSLRFPSSRLPHPLLTPQGWGVDGLELDACRTI